MGEDQLINLQTPNTSYEQAETKPQIDNCNEYDYQQEPTSVVDPSLIAQNNNFPVIDAYPVSDISPGLPETDFEFTFDFESDDSKVLYHDPLLCSPQNDYLDPFQLSPFDQDFSNQFYNLIQ